MLNDSMQLYLKHIIRWRQVKKTRKIGSRYDPLYTTWLSMFQRCYNPKDSGFKNYGARGIYVAEAWFDMAVFVSDMGEKPTHEHSLDRKDNNGPYSKANCVWATRDEQANNRRVHYTHQTQQKKIKYHHRDAHTKPFS